MELNIHNVSRMTAGSNLSLSSVLRYAANMVDVANENVKASEISTEALSKLLSKSIAALNGEYMAKKSASVSQNVPKAPKVSVEESTFSKVKNLIKNGEIPKKPEYHMVGRTDGLSDKERRLEDRLRAENAERFDREMNEYHRKLQKFGITQADIADYEKKHGKISKKPKYHMVGRTEGLSDKERKLEDKLIAENIGKKYGYHMNGRESC